MAGVRLTLAHLNRAHVFGFLRPDGRVESIPALRLSVIADLSRHAIPGLRAGKAAYPECVLDTGSHLSVLPEAVWGQLRPGAVTPLPFAPTTPAAIRVVALGGGIYPYDLGELDLRLRDLSGGILDVTVVAQLVHDAGTLNVPMILGLRGGVLDGRALTATPDPAAPHAQSWVLADP